MDLDDPSTDATIDLNGAAGLDNNGANQLGTLSAASALTDADGIARVTFETTKQPGDNFMIAASADETYLNGLIVNGVGLRDAAGNTLPTAKAKTTGMLTIWRNRHIEVDSMGPVTDNGVSGTILRAVRLASPRPPSTTVNVTLDRVVGGAYGDSFNSANRFGSNARLIVNGMSFALATRNSFSDNVIAVTTPNLETIPSGVPYFLVDDDDFNGDDGINRDGDNGEHIPRPDTSRLQVSDDPNLNLFAPAYVRPIYDVGDNNDFVPFVLNTASESAAGIISTYDFDARMTEADDDFWTVYLLNSYQLDAEGDHDPNTESDRSPSKEALAVSDAINGQGSTIFLEMFTEFGALNALYNPASTAVHELGHLFNGDHPDGGIMATIGSAQRTNAFSPITIAKIRRINHP